MQYMQNISKYADWLKQSTPGYVVPLAMFVHLDTGPILNINEQEPNIVFQVEGETLLIQWWGWQVGALCPPSFTQVVYTLSNTLCVSYTLSISYQTQCVYHIQQGRQVMWVRCNL